MGQDTTAVRYFLWTRRALLRDAVFQILGDIKLERH